MNEQNKSCELQNKSSYLSIISSDGKLMSRLIDWLNKQNVAPNSTVIRVHDSDPFAEIDGLTEQIADLKNQIKDLTTRELIDV